MNDFFLKQFGTDAGSSVLFRFDRFGSVLSEQDFIDSKRPDFGYSPAKAMEKFSDLVNHIPVDVNDGMNISLSEDSIADTYFYNLLKPSIPSIPYGADGDTKQSIINSFSSIKADALKIWESVKAESSAIMAEYKPCLATPEVWYDMTKNDVWASQSFAIASTSSTSTSSSSGQLWKLELTNEAMQRILKLPEMQPTASQPNVANAVVEQANLNAARSDALRQDSTIADAESLSTFTAATTINPNIDISATVSKASLYSTYLQQYRSLDISKRILANRYIENNAPTQSVESSSINISFDYCLVKVRRPWYLDVFMNQSSWYIPTVLKGQVKLPLMPIGFVAIRNLNIGADWTTEDIKNASNATHFGPFQVSLNLQTRQLVHPGLQIIGWILQKMPNLPPNQDPQYEEAAIVLSSKMNQLLSDGFRAVTQQFPEIMPPGSDQRRFAACLRDLNYYLKPVIDSCRAASTKPMDDSLSSIKEINQSLGYPNAWLAAFYQYVKANHGLNGNAAATANQYLDYAANLIS